MEIWLITAMLFASLVLFLALGLPIAFSLGGVAITFTLIFWGPQGLYTAFTTGFAEGTSFIFIAIPLFILMATLLQYSGIADDLYEMMYRWTGGLRGGLGMGTIIICAIFAAMAGISALATVTMGLIALPSMLRRNYDKRIAVGTICAGGALGILIPPSIIMIIYASMAGESVGKLFMGGVFPGILLASIFILYIAIRCFLQPKLGPAVPVGERYNLKEKLKASRAVFLPVVLIVVVLGSIYTGICTPTEASALGAFGALICLALARRFNWRTISDSALTSLNTTCMIIWIIIGAKCFFHIFGAIGASKLIIEAISALPVSRWLILIGMQLTFFVLGMFIDPAGIVAICAPIFCPIVAALGFDTLWFGILFVINMEMAYITPPFGFNLFYMKGIVPPGITMGDIYRSIWPFVALQALCLGIVMAVPNIALWLPNTMITK